MNDKQPIDPELISIDHSEGELPVDGLLDAPPTQINYVCGFYFDHLLNRVVLIWKNKPKWQEGKLNGVGGKIEAGETAEQAMRREFHEETGIDHEEWFSLINLSGVDWMVYFFYAKGKPEEFEYAETRESEEVAKIEIDTLDNYDHVANLQWLIPMALYKLKHPDELMSWHRIESKNRERYEITPPVDFDISVNWLADHLSASNPFVFEGDNDLAKGFSECIEMMKEILKDRVIVLKSQPIPSSIVRRLEEMNPYCGDIDFSEDKRIGYNKAVSKLTELLSAQPAEQGEAKNKWEQLVQESKNSLAYLKPGAKLTIDDWHKIYDNAFFLFYESHPSPVANTDVLVKALQASIEVIRGWQNMASPSSELTNEQEELAWKIYYEHSPEMKPIREALSQFTTPQPDNKEGGS